MSVLFWMIWLVVMVWLIGVKRLAVAMDSRNSARAVYAKPNMHDGVGLNFHFGVPK